MQILIPMMLSAVLAAETTQTLPPPQQCFSAAESQALVLEHGLVPASRAVSAARHVANGDLLAARLCETTAGHVYMLTLLGRDGRMQRVLVDAKSADVLAPR
jgi:uncharacterized membrane protein YkoI